MLEGLYSAAAGMSAQEQQLDAIGNDLANVSTEGYKSERIAFSDLLYNTVEQAGTSSSTGAGASAKFLGHSRSEGSIKETGQPLDLAIEGEGYFQVTGPGGQPALTRNGAFSVDASGSLTTADGNRLSPPIKLPAGVLAHEVQIAPDGTVTAGTHKLGQIQLVTVTSPDHLRAEGASELVPTAESGAPHAASEAKVRQGALEQSNVDVAKAMAAMVSTQRNYQLASTAIQNESQMMSIANELRP
ncbi:MAG TPA: flagellar hook-basal body protein [Solirubrobacteraceae bacterium]|jgi:flagellar basal-body rod protein FlgG|nr:flagellar hook-basal body protein [Solirubrobacteraceae bacterium]